MEDSVERPELPGVPKSTRESAASELVAPRLQLRWRPKGDGDDSGFGFDWQCVYELVLPLRDTDIRREVYEDGEQVGKRDVLALEISVTNCGRSGEEPCRAPDGSLHYDSPFRDGAHASWDSEALGGLPIFVIAPDGTAIAKPPPPAEGRPQ